VDEVCARLAADPLDGLSTEEAARRRRRFGPNQLPSAPPPSALARLAAQFADPLVGALLVAAGVAVGVATAEGADTWLEYADAIAILLIVGLNALLGFVQERRAEAALDALRKLASPRARVARDGIRDERDAAELVPGDLVDLDAGDAAPADLRLVDSVDLATQEAPLTGESTLVSKDASAVLPAEVGVADRRNLVHQGTTVARGRGAGIVVRTGAHTEFGRIGALVQSSVRVPTPLEERLTVFGRAILAICLAVSALLFLVGLVQGDRSWEILLLTAVSLAVAAIPEGLPAISTITLALGTQRMARRGAIVRKLPAVETLGSARVVCTDKTGTLTENRMTVRAVETWGALYRVTAEADGSGAGPFSIFGAAGPGFDGRGVEEAPGPAADAGLRALLQAGVLASSARLSLPASAGEAAAQGDPMEHRERGEALKVVGDPTEAALLVLAARVGIDKAALLAHRDPRRGGGARREVLRELPFDGDRKRMSVAVGAADDPGARTLWVKGSPDTLIPRCRAAVRPDGAETPLDDAGRRALLDRTEALAADAFRVLALARRALPEPGSAGEPELADADPDELERELAFLGLVAMHDPPRAEVREAVAQTQAAGIRVVMITGDHALTGVAIARELGFWREGDVALGGAELAAMDDAALDARIPLVSVFARVSAEQKLRIVRAFRRIGWVAAMTGDGINDAPALREAPIGIAMGRGGTDVAREAADMVLADDNFATIVAAIREGRAIFRNIQKFVFFLNSSNAGLVIAVIVGSFLPSVPQLTPLQLLWINLVTNGLPALALGVDPPEPKQMEEPPQEALEPIVGPLEIGGILAVGALMGAAALGMMMLPEQAPGLFTGATSEAQGLEARTMAFALLAVSPLFHAFNCRSRRRSLLGLPLFGNPYLWAAVGVSFLVQLVTIVWPPLHPIFRTVGLSGAEWGVVLAAAALPIPMVEVLKFALRRAVPKR
jgi:Ca2+-transporting ATPase